MRAYLAVIKDSFREALASRVLWILLLLTTVLLLLFAPLGLRDEAPAATSAEQPQPQSQPQTQDAPRVSVTYLGWKLGDTLPMTRKEVMPIVRLWLAGMMDFLVGALGVFCAILVTAPIIPHTFEAGAIDLLLSKPISRSLLFLTKFLGGCAFILLIGAYFVVGMWIIVGLRFDLWNNRLLLCIPLFLFLFAIYYSISAAAGVLWRNPVVSIVVTILFWAMCFIVGLMKGGIESFALNPQRLVKLAPAGDALIGVTEQGQVREWQDADRTWKDVFTAGDGAAAPPFGIANTMVGPVHDAHDDRLLAIPMPFRGGFGMSSGGATLSIGKRADGWKRRKGPATPPGTTALLVDPQGRVVVAALQGVFFLEKKDGEEAKGDDGNEKFVQVILDPPVRTDPPYAAAMNAESGEIVVWSRGTVTLLATDASGGFTRQREQVIEATKEATAAVAAYAGQTVLLALADGRVLVISASDLSVQHEFKPARDNPPRFAAAAPGGRWFSVLFHGNTLWLFDARSGKPADVSINGKGDVSAAAFDGPDTLLVADRGSRVTTYRLEANEVAERRTASMSGLERFYRYGVYPVYTLFPKPGELGNVVTYLLTEQETVAIGPNRNDLGQARLKIDVAGPLWSSFAFLVVVLGLTCVYVSRSDF